MRTQVDEKDLEVKSLDKKLHDLIANSTLLKSERNVKLIELKRAMIELGAEDQSSLNKVTFLINAAELKLSKATAAAEAESKEELEAEKGTKDILEPLLNACIALKESSDRLLDQKRRMTEETTRAEEDLVQLREQLSSTEQEFTLEKNRLKKSCIAKQEGKKPTVNFKQCQDEHLTSKLVEQIDMELDQIKRSQTYIQTLYHQSKALKPRLKTQKAKLARVEESVSLVTISYEKKVESIKTKLEKSGDSPLDPDATWETITTLVQEKVQQLKESTLGRGRTSRSVQRSRLKDLLDEAQGFKNEYERLDTIKRNLEEEVSELEASLDSLPGLISRVDGELYKVHDSLQDLYIREIEEHLATIECQINLLDEEVRAESAKLTAVPYTGNLVNLLESVIEQKGRFGCHGFSAAGLYSNLANLLQEAQGLFSARNRFDQQYVPLLRKVVLKSEELHPETLDCLIIIEMIEKSDSHQILDEINMDIPYTPNHFVMGALGEEFVGMMVEDENTCRGLSKDDLCSIQGLKGPSVSNCLSQVDYLDTELTCEADGTQEPLPPKTW